MTNEEFELLRQTVNRISKEIDGVPRYDTTGAHIIGYSGGLRQDLHEVLAIAKRNSVTLKQLETNGSKGFTLGSKEWAAIAVAVIGSMGSFVVAMIQVVG